MHLYRNITLLLRDVSNYGRPAVDKYTTQCKRLIQLLKIMEYLGLEGTHKDHQFQFLGSAQDSHKNHNTS